MTVASTDPKSPEPETVIWRYMNAAKFATLLDPFTAHADWGISAPSSEKPQPPGQLWFGYPWSFKDRFEGKLPARSRQREKYIEKVIKKKGLKKKEAAALRELYLSVSNAHLYDAIEATADLYGASCWQMNENVDPKMWRFSGRHSKKQGKDGVAVRSTVGLVKEALLGAQNLPEASRPDVCQVGYVSHGVYFTLNDGAKGILSLVRSKYKHQREVRFSARSPALAKINFTVSKTVTINMNERLAFSSEEEAIAYFRKAWGPFTNEGPEFHRERVEAIMEASVPKAEEIKRVSKDVRSKKVPGFNLPMKLAGAILEVVVSPESAPGYEGKVEQLLEKAGCENVHVVRGQSGDHDEIT
ncbi:hypothetical protein [Tautonia marina]|uniref:hypothetical protein n=1 Tax=Tautonia marina TaxID=2653855 RepID=UPI0012604D85|nr:hypothetical protein [Tautonia marina]